MKLGPLLVAGAASAVTLVHRRSGAFLSADVADSPAPAVTMGPTPPPAGPVPGVEFILNLPSLPCNKLQN